MLTGLIKNYSTQNSLLIIIEKWKQSIDKNEKVGTILMDLSKAFLSQFTICQTKYFQYDKIWSKLFFRIILKGKYIQQFQRMM